MSRNWVAVATGAALAAALVTSPPAASRALAQEEAVPTNPGSANIEVVAHIPLGVALSVTDIVIEQELSRPYAYVGRMFGADKGFDIIDLRDPKHARVLYRWRIENAELHQGLGGMDPKYFKWKGRTYVVQSVQFGQGGPDADLGAVVLDVSGLPDVKKIKEVGRIHAPDAPGGFHNIFVYKHSDGRVLLFATVSAPHAAVYDLGRLVDEGAAASPAGEVPIPDDAENPSGRLRAYHDFYVGYDPATGQDKFYGGGLGGYYVYDITQLAVPTLLTSITGVSGVRAGHTFTPTPDGRYAVAETEYQYAPLRIFDLRPGLDGDVQTIREPIGAWTANWQNLSHNHEVRWPYVFVSAYEDGLQVFNMMDPRAPVTVAYYDTYPGAHKVGMCRSNICNGAFGVDVRNADGLIVLSDMSTGFWAFRMKGFGGWNGRGWGVPNISSAQDWENGPEGAGGP